MTLTLADAADFIAEQARELAGLSLAYMATPENIRALQKQATQNWQQSKGGWHGYSRGYGRRKGRWVPNGSEGVLTGAWQDYRTLNRAELVFHSVGNNMALQMVALNPTKAQKSSDAWHVVGKKTISQKPRVEYPQRRCLEMPTDFITPAEAAILPACKGDNLAQLLSQLPLRGINWRPLTKRGVPLARIGGRQIVVLKSAWRRALK